MKIFFYTGRNPERERCQLENLEDRAQGPPGSNVVGSCQVDKRQIVPTATLQTPRRTHRTEDSAKANESRRIREKINSGYEKKP